jgi:hypothetical protein
MNTPKRRSRAELEQSGAVREQNLEEEKTEEGTASSIG